MAVRQFTELILKHFLTWYKCVINAFIVPCAGFHVDDSIEMHTLPVKVRLSLPLQSKLWYNNLTQNLINQTENILITHIAQYPITISLGSHISETWIADEKWDHVFCAYKLCRVEFPFWGFQTRVERYVCLTHYLEMSISIF